MTISSTTVKNSYSGNGSTVTFNYTFKIFASSDLEVIIRDDDTATETVQTLNTHYSITGVGDANGGSITFLVDAAATPPYDYTPAVGETVVLRRNVPQTQAIDYIANDPFPAESHEEGLDRLTMQMQQVQEEIDRSIKLSKTNTMTDTSFAIGATDRASKVLAFDDSGEISVTQELGTYQGDWSADTDYNARDLVKDTSTNNIFLVNADHTSSGSQPLTTNTNSSKYDLIVDAAAASTSATNAASSASAAATSESNAATSASNAATSASNASTSETNAATSETNASNSATAAQTAQAAAESALDTFDDAFLGSKSTDPTVDNDGNALADGALYFNTTDNVMKVYDLGNTEWKQLTPTAAEQTNIDTVAGISSDISSVVSNESNINTVSTNIADISSVAGISSNVTTVSGISSDVTAVADDATDIGTVASNLTGDNDIGTVSTNIANVNNVGGSITNVNTVASNLSDVNNFANTYRISATAPTDSLDIGDLWFDTTNNQMKVYSSTGWIEAASSINGTAARFKYTATNGQTTFSGADDEGETLAYDSGFIDVYLNGIHLLPSDYTATNGTSIVLNSGANANDELYIVAFGTFSITDVDASNITSGTLNNARLTGSGQITINGTAVALGGSITTFTRPTVTSISPDTITNAQTAITITGTGFVSVPIVEAIGTDGSIIRADTVTYNSSTSITANFTIATDASYYIRVENNDGFAGRSSTALLTVSDAPSFTTTAGTLGTFSQGDAISVTVAATSDSTITYSVQSGSLPTGLSLNSSTGVISGTESGSDTNDTTYNFTIRATDEESLTADRAFSITISVAIQEGMQFN